ncbi:glycosyltransferase family 4 protein [Listeria ilorinensis]|uniref:glycosyltransferase family 4 protein n=1 Tax=Listeria ilorinensis TaxID=2867439 RepID=UPI001EF58454|nr:glycosyltransferase family 4 protein [Listeria ilorinensis]
MNIGIFTDTYSPQISGVATSIMILEKELRKQGHNVYVFTTTDPNADRKSEEGRVFRMPSIPFVFFPERRVAIAGMNKFIRLVGELKLDIIHTHTEFSLGLLGKKIAKKYHIPSIHTYHTMYVDYLHYIAKGKILTPSMVRKMTRSFCESYSAVIAPTQKVQHHLEECGVQNYIYTIPTGTDLSSFKKSSDEQVAELKLKLGLKLDAPVILSLGRVAHEKNIDAVIMAMPEILAKKPDAQLVVVGDGPVRKDLEKMAEMNGQAKNILFTGAVDWQEIGNYYQLGDLFVSASTSETQGLTYFEAMASGVPVVAKQDESIEGFLTNEETAFLFKNDHQLAHTILHALEHPQLVERVIASADQVVEAMSAEQFGLNVEAAYLEIKAYFEDKEKLTNRMKPTLIRSKIASQVFSISSNTHVRKGRSSRHD